MDSTDKPKVIELDSQRPHSTGWFTCRLCFHVWMAVWDDRATELECPTCGARTPVWMGLGNPDPNPPR